MSVFGKFEIVPKTEQEREMFNCEINKIENHNCVGLCSEMYCNNPETNFIEINIEGIYLTIALCGKHAEDLTNRLSQSVKTKFQLQEEQLTNGS